MMSLSNDYIKYVKSGFVDHKYLFIFTLLVGVLCWIGGYFVAELMFTPQELVDLEYLAQETSYSFDDFLFIVVNNCFINLMSYVDAIFFGFGPFYDMMVNMGMSGVISRATDLACGDPFLFLKLTCLHGFFEDLSTILNSFAGFILFSFIVRYIKNLFSPSQNLSEGRFSNSWQINKKHLYQSIAIFILGMIVMIYAGFLEEYVSVPFGNLVAFIL